MKELVALDVLKAYVAKFPTQTAAAKTLGVTQPFLGDMLKGHRQVSPKIMDALGLRKIVVLKKAS